MWTKVSPQLKDLCARLLERDPEKRFTYQQAMDHPWLNVDTYPSAALNDTMVQKFQSHGSFHRLKRKVLTEALKYLELEETGELAMIFSKLDVDHDGFITKKEMVRGLEQYGYKVSNHDSKVIIENVDVDGNGQLDQNEFVVALLDLKTLQKDRKWQQVGHERPNPASPHHAADAPLSLSHTRSSPSSSARWTRTMTASCAPRRSRRQRRRCRRRRRTRRRPSRRRRAPRSAPTVRLNPIRMVTPFLTVDGTRGGSEPKVCPDPHPSPSP